MNSTPNLMGGVFLLLLIGLTIYAVIGGKGKWKAINLLIVVAFVAVGISIGAALGMWGGSPEIGGYIALSLGILLGCVGAFGCIRRNRKRMTPGS